MIVEENYPEFGSSLEIYSPFADMWVKAFVTRTPFSKECTKDFWMFKNSRTQEYTWREIMPSDVYREEKQK